MSLWFASANSSLVAGNVTGGGGKATTTKTYWHRAFLKAQHFDYSFWMLTGNALSARDFSGYKIGKSRVYMFRFATLFENTSVFSLRYKNTPPAIYFVSGVFVLKIRLFANLSSNPYN